MIHNFSTFNESFNPNDDVLVKLRANQIEKQKRDKFLEEQRLAKKNEIKLNVKKIEELKKLLLANDHKEQMVLRDMSGDPRIEPEGGPVADYYGEMLNELTEIRKKLLAKLRLEENPILKNKKLKKAVQQGILENMKHLKKFNEGYGILPDMAGKRIRCVRMNDDPMPIEPGSEGEIVAVNSLGDIEVRWDNGRSLSLIPGVDEYEIIDNE